MPNKVHQCHGFSFEAPSGLEAVDMFSEAEVAQFADAARGLAVSGYTRSMPLKGPLGLEAATGRVEAAFRETNDPVESQVVDDGDTTRVVVINAADPYSARVVVAATRRENGDVAVLEVSHPIGSDHDLEAVSLEIARSLRASASG